MVFLSKKHPAGRALTRFSVYNVLQRVSSSNEFSGYRNTTNRVMCRPSNVFSFGTCRWQVESFLLWMDPTGSHGRFVWQVPNNSVFFAVDVPDFPPFLRPLCVGLSGCFALLAAGCCRPIFYKSARVPDQSTPPNWAQHVHRCKWFSLLLVYQILVVLGTVVQLSVFLLSVLQEFHSICSGPAMQHLSLNGCRTGAAAAISAVLAMQQILMALHTQKTLSRVSRAAWRHDLVENCSNEVMTAATDEFGGNISRGMEAGSSWRPYPAELAFNSQRHGSEDSLPSYHDILGLKPAANRLPSYAEVSSTRTTGGPWMHADRCSYFFLPCLSGL